MEYEPHLLFRSLHDNVNNVAGNLECKRLLNSLNHVITEEQLNSADIDLYLVHIFNKSYGLIKFLTTVLLKKDYKYAIVKGLEILYALLNNFPEKLEKHILDVNELCMCLLKSKVLSYEKVKALEVLMLGFEKVDKCLENKEHYAQILETLHSCLTTKSSDSVREKELLAVGLFAKKFSYLILHHEKIWQVFHNCMVTEMSQPNKSQPLLSGIFTGLSYVCESFSLDPNDQADATFIEKIYGNVKVMAKPTTDRIKTANRAALNFFANNISSFSQVLMKDIKGWHKLLISWSEMDNNEDHKVGLSTLKAYYRQLAAIFKESPGTYQKQVMYFVDYCKTQMTNDSQKVITKHLALEGLRLLSPSCFVQLPPEQVSELFIYIMQKFEELYFLKQDDPEESRELLPDYIRLVASFMPFRHVTSAELFCLQRAVIIVIKSFPKLPDTQHYLVIDSMVVTFESLRQNDLKCFEEFVENIVYQGIVWTCSREHIFDAETHDRDADANVDTMKKYFPFWLGLLKIQLNRSYDKIGIFFDDRMFILNTFVNKLIKTLLILVNKLNVTVSLKEIDDPTTDVQTAYQVEHVHDYSIYLNVVELYREILENIYPESFQTCIGKLMKHFIVKCVQYPLVSGFYKLLSVCLKISNKLHYYDEDKIDSIEDVTECYHTLMEFLKELLTKINHYKDELLISCLQVLLETPTSAIKEMLPACISPFITVFNVGRSYSKLAEMGMKTLEQWSEKIPSEQMEPFLIAVIPILDTYLRSKTLGTSQVKETKRRKTAQRLQKRKILLEIEPELVQLQKRILKFVGQQNCVVSEAFVNTENSFEQAVWSDTPHLKVTLPYPDVKLDIYFDNFVPRIVDLSLNCSDRKTRMVACELLQAVVMIFLGRTKQLSHSGLSDLDKLLECIATPLLLLGCDVDPIVQQLFQPLVLQLIHWYTSPAQLGAAHTAIIIDAIMEGITHPSNSSLRDFSGKCVNEFMSWTAKQISESRLARDPVNVKVLIRKMRFFSTHPDLNKKLGAALIFNNIYREMREERALLSMFWVELLYIFVNLLNNIDTGILEADNTIAQAKSALRHLQRGFVEKHELFNEIDRDRRIPSDIKGGLLKDVCFWLLEKTGSLNKYCREICMEMFCTITSFVPRTKNLQEFIKSCYKNQILISQIYEKHLANFTTLQDRSIHEYPGALSKWLNGFMCNLDGYIFIMVNNLAEICIDTAFCRGFKHFLEEIAVAKMEEALILVSPHHWSVTSQEKELFNKEKAACIVKILKLVNCILNSDKSSEFCNIFWTNLFENLLVRIIFTPQSLAMDDRLHNIDYIDILTILLNNIQKKLPGDKLLHFSQIINDFIKNKSITDINVKSNVPLNQRNLVKGLILIHSILVNQSVKVEELTDGGSLVDRLLTNFCENSENGVIYLNDLQDTTVEHCLHVLEFALCDEREFKKFVEYLFKPYMVHSLESVKELHFGVYICRIFEGVILKAVVERFEVFVDLMLGQSLTDCTFQITFFILSRLSVSKNKFRHQLKHLMRHLLRQWRIFEDYFNQNVNNALLGVDFLKILLPACKAQSLEEFNQIQNWLSSLLLREEDLLKREYFEIFYLLVRTVEVEETSEALVNGIFNLKKELFAKINVDAKAATVSFTKLLSFSGNLKSLALLKFIVEVYVEYVNEKIENIGDVLLRVMLNLKENEQGLLLQTFYEKCLNDDLTIPQRRKLNHDVIPPMFHNCNLKQFKNFFVSNIGKILSSLNESTTDENLISKITNLILFEILFLRSPIQADGDSNCPITEAAISANENNKRLVPVMLKIMLDVQREIPKVSPENENIFRIYKCHGYNTFASIVSNSVRNPNLYAKLFVRTEDGQDVLWKGIVNTKVDYQFPKDFKSLPERKKALINIRTKLKESRRASGAQSSSARYIESQKLFNSSLSEDISKFDFSNTVLRNESKENLEEGRDFVQSAIELDATEINSHECMATVCGLIEHIFSTGVSSLPEEDEEPDIDLWMKGLRDVLLDHTTHNNVKIFLIKVIDNMYHIFQHFAQYFLEPILRFLADKCAGKSLNYFYDDVLSLLASWSKTVTPNDSETELASKVFYSFIVDINIERRDVFKYHLELVKLLVESWKTHIKTPYDILRTKLSRDVKDINLEVTLHLHSIFLANKIAPWNEITKPHVFKSYFEIVANADSRSIYRTCAETIGLALRLADDDELGIMFDKVLQNIDTNKSDKYAAVLEGVVIHCPKVANEFHLCRILSRLEGAPVNLKIIYSKILLKRCEFLLEGTVSDFKEVNWERCLESENVDVQVICLEIIKECLEYVMPLKSFMVTLNAVAKNLTNPNHICRGLTYDIAKKYLEVGGNKEGDAFDICMNILIQGLVDKDVQDKVVEFFASSELLPSTVIERFSEILETLYRNEIEDYFLGYSTFFLIDVIKSTDAYNENIFEHPLEDCDFEDYVLHTNWRLQHPSTVPLFAETLKSYNDEFQPFSKSSFGELRKTQANFSFAPTQSVKPSAHIVTSESALLIDPDVSVSDDGILNPNLITISDRYKKPHRRFLKDRYKMSRFFANEEVKKSKEKVQKRFQAAKEAGQKVIIYRSYRKGDFPDIEISLASVLQPLQMLALHDNEISKSLYTVFFKSINSKAGQNEQFFQSVSRSIVNIFTTSTKFNTNLFRTLLDITFKNQNKMYIDPTLISRVCQASGLVPNGTLILEEYLLNSDDLPSSSKKGPGAQEDRSTLCWLKLAELYKELEEWDVVKSIFLEKMNCKETVQDAIKAESNKVWREAQLLYERLIKTDVSLERKDFYYESYFKCFANLGEWEKLPSSIEDVVTSTVQDNPWEVLWDGSWNQQKILPWYMMAQVRNMIFTQTSSSKFLKNLNSCLEDPQKADYLKKHFSEELCIMLLFNNDVDDASRYLKEYMDNFLESWQLLNPMFSSLRLNKLLKLRNIVDIDKSLSTYKNLNVECEDAIKNLRVQWDKTANEFLPSIILNETRLLYRRQFLSLLNKKLATFGEESSLNLIKDLKRMKLKLDYCFIDRAIKDGNHYMARKYYKDYHGKGIFHMSLALSKIAYLKAKTLSEKEDQVKQMLEAVTIIEPILQNAKKLELKLSVNMTLFDILADCGNIFQVEEDIFTNNRTDFTEVLNATFPTTNDFSLYAIDRLKKFVHKYEDHLENAMETDSGSIEHSEIAKAYVKMAYHIKDNHQENFADFMLFVLRAMKLDSFEAKQLFPCILMNPNLGDQYKELFENETEKIPTWMFLGWIPQLLANVDSPKVPALSSLIKRIARTYPQAIMYAYRLSKENYKFEIESVKEEENRLIQSLDSYLLGDKIVDKFLNALSYVSVPEGFLKYYVTKLLKSCSNNNRDSFETILKYITDEIYKETPNSKDVTCMQGNMFKRIDKYKKQFTKMNANNLRKTKEELTKLREALDDDKPSKLLKDYCPWLANFSANDIDLELEIPGQYDGKKLPLVQHHAKISGFCPNVSIMSSLRKPIKLTILGLDTKEYPFLLKFGEDIRQDQRIEQLFDLMNNIFKTDSTFADNLNILTYQVIPLTSSLGIIQWINDTKPLKEFIERSLKDKELQTFKTSGERYYNRISNRRQIKMVDIYGIAAIKRSRDETISFYRSMVNQVPWDVLKTGFWNLSVNTESFIALRNNFIKTYAMICACHWILGIGDRHLSNSLICLRNGKVLGIDFGHAFGTATQILPVPELVPFRLTPHIINFMGPLEEKGIFKECMIRCLKALRNNSSSLLATMNVFVEEPSLDWLEHASRFENDGERIIEGWYTSQKVLQARRKLQGATSMSIMIEELSAGAHDKKYQETYVNLVKGSVLHDVRAKIKDVDLTVEEQVSCLIDHATDYNLLGRMYHGWQPWV